MSRWMTRPGWGGSQTRVCDTGPQFTPFSLFRCGSQRYSAIRTSCRESDARETYGYVRTSRPRVSDLSGSDPETQRQQLLAAGVALSHIYQDVGISGTSGTNSRRGWHSLDSRLSPGRHLGCGVHRPHRAALAGHDGEHPRPSTARGEDSQPGRQRTVLGPVPGCRPRLAGVVFGLYPGRFRRLGVRPGTGVRPPAHQGGFGEGEGGRQETGRSSPVVGESRRPRSSRW